MREHSLYPSFKRINTVSSSGRRERSTEEEPRRGRRGSRRGKYFLRRWMRGPQAKASGKRRRRILTKPKHLLGSKPHGCEVCRRANVYFRANASPAFSVPLTWGCLIHPFRNILPIILLLLLLLLEALKPFETSVPLKGVQLQV